LLGFFSPFFYVCYVNNILAIRGGRERVLDREMESLTKEQEWGRKGLNMAKVEEKISYFG
jgi:hypothetical protein